MCGLLEIGSMMGPPLLCFLPTLLLVNSTGSLLVHPFSANVSGVEPSPGFHVASLCRMVGRAENTFLFSLVFSKGAVLVPGFEAGEEDAMFDATLAAMCGLAPWCRALGWLAPNGFQVFFVPRLAGNAGVEPSGVQVVSLCRVVCCAENTFMVSLSFLNGAVLVPGLEAEDFQDFLTLRLAGNTGFLVGKTCYQDGFCEGQRKGCERHKVIGSSKALLLISVPQVILALWCLAAAKSGIFVVMSVQAAASGAFAGILFSKFLFCAAAAFGMTIALVVLYCGLCARSGIRVAAVSAFVNACAAASFLAAASVSLHGHVLGLRIVLTARIVEMAMCARQAFESQREAGHRLASSPAVGTGVQATGRVDVPGEASDELHMLKVAAAPCTTNLQQASALSERYGGGPVGKDSFSIQIFVRDLSGKTLSLQVSSHATGSELSITVSGITGVPPEFFYLTIGGRIFGDRDFLGNFGVSSGTHVQMNGRMRGGARPPAVFIPGQWTCGACGMEGCWPARTRCYRCNAPRSGAPPLQASPVGPPRESAYPGKPAAPQSVPVNPARRAPRRPAFKQPTPAADPAPGPLPVGPVDLGNAQAISQIIQALATMGLPDLLLQQIRSSIPPAPVAKTKDLSIEQRLARLGGRIKILEQQSAKLEKNKARLQEEFLETEKSMLKSWLNLKMLQQNIGI